jgi:hypothetical protein
MVVQREAMVMSTRPVTDSAPIAPVTSAAKRRRLAAVDEQRREMGGDRGHRRPTAQERERHPPERAIAQRIRRRHGPSHRVVRSRASCGRRYGVGIRRRSRLRIRTRLSA